MNRIKTTKLGKSCAEDLNKARARSGSATRDDYSSQKNGRFIRVCIYKRWNEESRRDSCGWFGTTQRVAGGVPRTQRYKQINHAKADMRRHLRLHDLAII